MASCKIVAAQQIDDKSDCRKATATMKGFVFSCALVEVQCRHFVEGGRRGFYQDILEFYY